MIVVVVELLFEYFVNHSFLPISSHKYCRTRQKYLDGLLSMNGLIYGMPSGGDSVDKGVRFQTEVSDLSF